MAKKRRAKKGQSNMSMRGLAVLVGTVVNALTNAGLNMADNKIADDPAKRINVKKALINGGVMAAGFGLGLAVDHPIATAAGIGLAGSGASHVVPQVFHALKKPETPAGMRGLGRSTNLLDLYDQMNGAPSDVRFAGTPADVKFA